MNWTLWFRVADGGKEAEVRIDVEGDRPTDRQMKAVRYAAIQNAPEIRGMVNPTILAELLQPGDWRDPPAVQQKLARSPWSVCMEVMSDGNQRRELKLTFASKPDDATLEKLWSVAEQVALEMGHTSPRTVKQTVRSGDFRQSDPARHVDFMS